MTDTLVTPKRLSVIGVLAALAMISVLVLIRVTPALGDHGEIKVTLPFEETGIIGRADYIIKVPDPWNGKLVIDHRSGGGAIGLQPIPAESLILNSGYAIAASGYSVPLGDGLLKEGPKDTNRLVEYFMETVGVPDRIMLMGRATGASFVAKLIEKHPDRV